MIVYITKAKDDYQQFPIKPPVALMPKDVEEVRMSEITDEVLNSGHIPAPALLWKDGVTVWVK